MREGTPDEFGHTAVLSEFQATDDVDLLTRGDEPKWRDETAEMLSNHPIGVVREVATGVQNGEDGWLKALEFEDGTVREYESGFATYGSEYNNGLARNSVARSTTTAPSPSAT